MRGRKKYVIGLTGNIATGKSTVARMLAHLGARVIDADVLVHRLLDKDAALRQAIVAEFGSDILDEKGKIVRARLAQKVFNDPAALRRLEEIVHPRVIAITQRLVEMAPEDVVVVEAIKLIEAGMHKKYDALWVVTCSREQQLRRLVKKRGMSRKEALMRIRAQPPQEEKIALADVVIQNDGDIFLTWEQVKKEWEKIQRVVKGEKAIIARRAAREDAAALAQVMTEILGRPVREEEALGNLRRRGYIIAWKDTKATGALGWHAENLVAFIDEVLLPPSSAPSEVMPPLLRTLEVEAGALLCEVVMVGLREDDRLAAAFEKCGFHREEVASLHRIWREVAEELLQPGQQLYIKKLRREMILTPV